MTLLKTVYFENRYALPRTSGRHYTSNIVLSHHVGRTKTVSTYLFVRFHKTIRQYLPNERAQEVQGRSARMKQLFKPRESQRLLNF